MLKEVKEQVKKLGAFTRASIAADFTSEAEAARDREEFGHAFTLLHVALILQPRRQDAKKRLAEVRGAAPASAKLKIDNLDEESLNKIMNRLRQVSAEQPGVKNLTFKTAKARRQTPEKSFTLSLAFAAFFIVALSGYNIFAGIARTIGGEPLNVFIFLLGVLGFLGGYHLMKMRLLGLGITLAIALYMFVGFWIIFACAEIGKAQIVRESFLFGALPAFLLLIMLAINTRRIIRKHKIKSE